MAIVTVDFDGTLYKGDSFKIMFQIAKKEYTSKEWIPVAAGLGKAAISGILKGKNVFKKEFFKAFAKGFRGKTKQEMDTFFEKLVELGKTEVHTELIDRIKEHQSKGDTIILLSGALQPFLEAFVKEVDLRDVHIISTTLTYYPNGVCTGELGNIVNGEGKVTEVKRWMMWAKKEGRLSQEELNEMWAYADSETDIPLFRLADHPVVVNPKSAMKHVAIENAWPLF
ncbi:HAD family phosphatase [Virgibacillus sp. SK37]|uniref:HAD family hydrolase n=1 Tax=Virgibacillus sp. SK37 TaxID=403957 RepID=UPI0004D1E97C|nr:HAD-IB family hydrolase [Virgibacillus sp. SK37]AIF44313.1 haloacid dehalogenase [Virgibacillus sp. SK37]